MGGGGGLTPDSYELARGGNWVGQTEPPVWRSENDSPRGNRGRGGSATPLPYRVTSMSKATAPEEQGALLTTAEAAAGAWPSLRPGRGHRDTRRARVRAGTRGRVRRGPAGTPDGQACSRQQAAGGLRGNGPASNVIYFNIKARVQIDNETANRIIVRPEGPSRGQD